MNDDNNPNKPLGTTVPPAAMGGTAATPPTDQPVTTPPAEMPVGGEVKTEPKVTSDQPAVGTTTSEVKPPEEGETGDTGGQTTPPTSAI